MIENNYSDKIKILKDMSFREKVKNQIIKARDLNQLY